MKIIIKSTLVFFIIFAAAVPGLTQSKKPALLETFEFQDRPYSLAAFFSPTGADIILRDGPASINLSAGLGGENIFLGKRPGRDNTYIFWLNTAAETIRLAYYDLQRNRSRVLALAGFSFIGLPQIVETGDDLQGLVFLGNRSNNDDLFYYEPETEILIPLTATPFSEKGFRLVEIDGRLEIETGSLWSQYRYRFDPRTRRNSLLEEKRLHSERERNAVALTATYCNTYIGFGDSVTWGKIEGEQNLVDCYLAQMKTILADPAYENYYGAAYAINLGVPGEDTLAGAKRIDKDLATYQGFYFLLMMGVNDIYRLEFSLDSSLENLAYMIDAAKDAGMRLIVSTLTPSKDIFSQYDYYWENLYALSAGIVALAEEKEVACIDPLTVFMNTNPPNGWKDLLERIITGVSNGNHPNAAGHRIIAGLFADVLASFPPLPPSGVRILNPEDNLIKNVQWDLQPESDFDHFAIEFDFERSLSQHLTTTSNHFSFTLFPFLPQLYFRLKTVDRGDRSSEYTPVYSAQAKTASAAKPPQNTR